MITSDLTLIIQWQLMFLGFGLIFLPLTSKIFNNFFDLGYALSKILGLLLISYTSWLMSSLHIWPFGFYSVWLVFLLWLVINRIIAFKSPSIDFKKYWRVFLLEEALFFGGLIFWSFVRSAEPSIHGLEKFMDYGFMQSILKTSYMPPLDLWYTPLGINYYYFGHFWAALLMKMGSFNPDIAYNLILASIFGICLSVSFSIGANLFYLWNHLRIHPSRYTIITGFISAFLVTLGGNLHTIYIFFQNYIPAESPVPFWQLPLLLNFSNYWYPNATRFIPFTIHEFPIYSYVVADLHGHVLNIPFVMLFLGVLISLYHKTRDTNLAEKFLLGLMLSVFLMTNVLDGPIYLLILILVLISKNRFSVIKNIFLIILLMIFFGLPFFLNFKPFASGIGLLCAPQFLINLSNIGPLLFENSHCQKSPLWMLIILWGFFLYVLLGFLSLIIGKNIKRFLALQKTDQLVLILSLAALILILIPEFFYAKDIYPNHFRANTVFKFGYQAFIILGLISGYMISRLIASKKMPLLYGIILLILAGLVSIYPYFAISSYYNSLKNPGSLDGFKYFQKLYPDDYQAILWLRQNISGQPVILEAEGDSYTDYARVSSNTGLPTILGWPVHEWLWRGSYDLASPRIKDIEILYSSQDLNVTRELLQKYQIKYVFLGALEKQKYPNLNSGKFGLLGKEIFKSGDTKIYQILDN